MKYKAILWAGALAICLTGFSSESIWASPGNEAGSADNNSSLSLTFGQAAFDSSWEIKQLFQEGKSLQRQGQLERAVALYNQAYSLDSARIEVLPYWGLAEYRLGHYYKALALYNLYLASEPEEELVLFNKAVCLSHLGQWTEAKHISEKLQASSLSKSAQFLAFSGFLDYRLGDFTSAEAKLKQALRLQKDNISASLTLASLYQAENDLVKAELVLHEAIELQPKNILLANNLGVLNWQVGRYKQAEAYWREAQDSLNLADLNEAVYRVFSQGEADILTLAALTDKFPENPLAEFLYAVSLYRNRRLSEAKAGFNKVGEMIYLASSDNEIKNGSGLLTQQELGTLSLVNKNYLALTLASLGETASALAYYQELYKEQPKDISICHNLSVLYNKSGNNKEAVEFAQKARALVHEAVNANSQLRIQYEPVYYNLAYVYSLAKDKQKAAQAYNEWRSFFASKH